MHVFIYQFLSHNNSKNSKITKQQQKDFLKQLDNIPVNNVVSYVKSKKSIRNRQNEKY